MIIVLQRVKEASVSVQNKVSGKIQRGVCLLVGIEKGDTEGDAQYLARKIAELRIFPDNEGKMNLSLCDVQGEVLAVSQFTLAGSVKKGRRPSFDKAEEPLRAGSLFRYFVDQIKKFGLKVETGIFAELMDVCLINEGPVTFILQKKDTDTIS
ncbi:MAG: D-tyrosyl-tRNA(Tyr) deacylase [Candidatus Aminicenantes bacterium]|nr:MAG: D-tyrosyl-tRNA(Tyr) deacylase [Candidatus Aminicenantes bacterium]